MLKQNRPAPTCLASSARKLELPMLPASPKERECTSKSLLPSQCPLCRFRRQPSSFARPTLLERQRSSPAGRPCSRSSRSVPFPRRPRHCRATHHGGQTRHWLQLPPGPPATTPGAAVWTAGSSCVRPHQPAASWEVRAGPRSAHLWHLDPRLQRLLLLLQLAPSLRSLPRLQPRSPFRQVQACPNEPRQGLPLDWIPSVS
mmetsp:Transcript_14219/g.30864  ORF Transcript_14219/g.30864 Transcript_14219/m.30864 type:complete len:201 (-) Transcript_14219:806-1408(-)